MPLYDYRCDDCGSFRALRPMAEADRPQPCPGCGTACDRELTAPFLGGGAGAGWLGNTMAGGSRGSWRHACGFGCRHANCGA